MLAIISFAVLFSYTVYYLLRVGLLPSHSDSYFELKYLKDLQYLAKEDSKTSENLFDLHLINTVYKWSYWFETTEENKVKIQKLMNNILNRNSNLTIANKTTFEYYKNVSLPQTMWTWQRIYDNLNLNNNELDFNTYILSENNELILIETGENLIYE